MIFLINLKNINFKNLSKEDLHQELLHDFNRYQEVIKVWRLINDKMVLVNSPFIDDWDINLKEEIVAHDFYNCINSNGIVICAIYNDKVVAFASLLHDFFRSENQYLDLMQLHVSYEFRRYGLGRMLFKMCVDQAEEWGAKKIYISAHSAEETQAFYKSLGCVDAIEINKRLVDLEPYDCQLEYLITS